MEDITSDYRFLLRLVNTFTNDTDAYYPVCYKVNDAKTFKNHVASYRYFMLANHHVCYRLARLTEAFKIIAIDFGAVYCQVSLEGNQTIFVGSFPFAKGQQLNKLY